MNKKIYALLATSRIANVPSVISNVITGSVLSSFVSPLPDYTSWEITRFIIVACFLYIGGNFLNDWHDYDWDKENRPERALPSNLFARSSYLVISATLLIIACGLSFSQSNLHLVISLFIIGFIIAYTFTHKKSVSSIWLMGACRAGLYAYGAAYFIEKTITDLFIDSYSGNLAPLTNLAQLNIHQITNIAIIPVLCLGMIFYIAGISLLARYEKSDFSNHRNIKVISALMLLSPVITHGLFFLSESTSPSYYFKMLGIIFLACLPFITWTLISIFKKSLSVKNKVSRLLAGISLIDSILFSIPVALIIFDFVNTIISGDQFNMNLSIIAYSVIPYIMFACSLVLQKFSPAT
jgi:4-hydroxybenzoate polyprenyltransferase